MTQRTRDNLITALMVALILALILTVTSCTIYRITSERDEDGIVKTTANIYSTRKMTAVDLGYARDGPDASFTFSADEVNQAGPQEYAAGVVAGIEAARGIPTAQPKDDDQ